MSMAFIHPAAPFSIQGLGPPPDGHEYGGWGFSVALDYQFARRCLEYKRPDGERLTGGAQAVVRRLFPKTAEPGRWHPLAG